MKTSLHVPQGELAEAVFGIAFVSTLDEPWPPDQPRLNRFPAMVYCGVTMLTEGQVAVLGEEDGALAHMPDWIVFGPRTRPVTSVTLAPLRCVSVIFYPDAFALLTGRAPAQLQDRDEPASSWLPAEWGEWPQALRARAQDEAAQAQWIESWLLPRWLDARKHWNRKLGESLRQLARRGVAATVRTLGVGERQMQRQYRAQVGLTPAQARRLQRMNEAVYALRNGAAEGETLAALAAELGYADQAHMARELRALTGLPPSRLEQHIGSDPDYWPYRL
ncbi:helix-turn-helix domain-containing protein [Massilia solisilvae]|uniref:Helix-turn-helix domain-containing protein n=1 Tax=Massilia solisilvae TaxID=1811225 RepID=A0ABT2BFN7_9BURK|nr:helix-turn-helix domain-containing protein [Massilia solisilvae]MCS0607326.1 helix-turn-helix domain-containing protein [Massilia solisilvae]